MYLKVPLPLKDVGDEAFEKEEALHRAKQPVMISWDKEDSHFLYVSIALQRTVTKYLRVFWIPTTAVQHK